QFCRSHAAVEANADKWSMRNRIPKCFQSLARKGAAAGIENRAGRDYRHPLAALIEILSNRKELCFQHQGIDGGFRQQDIHTAFNEPAHLFFKYFNHTAEGQFTQSRVIDIKWN